jgi:hypothetical protein
MYPSNVAINFLQNIFLRLYSEISQRLLRKVYVVVFKFSQFCA